MDTVEKLCDLLVDVEAAYLFGSCAYGREDEYSDLDIMIVSETNEDFFHRHKEFPQLYELGRPIDLFVYTPEEFKQMKEAKNPFVMNILKTGIRIR